MDFAKAFLGNRKVKKTREIAKNLKKFMGMNILLCLDISIFLICEKNNLIFENFLSFLKLDFWCILINLWWYKVVKSGINVQRKI